MVNHICEPSPPNQLASCRSARALQGGGEAPLTVFRHELPFDRSSLTRWRQRLGEEQIVALLQESLSVAHRTGAIATKDLERVAIDTTVQEKAIAHPIDARLTHRAIGNARGGN